MHKVNAGLTVLVPVRPDRVHAASELLSQLHADQAGLPFAHSSTTHFATVTIIPAQTYVDEQLPATLLFATSYCGPTRTHVTELVDVMAAGLRSILEHCEGFDRECSDEEIEQFLLDHRVGDTFYSGMNHLSPEDVQRHRQLRDAIEAFVDEEQARGGMRGTAREVRKQIQDYVISRPDLAWAREPHKPSRWAWLVYHWRSLAVEAAAAALIACTVAWCLAGGTVLGAIVAAGWIGLGGFIAFLIVLVISIRDAEDDQTYVSQRPTDERARTLAATQTRPVINEFTLAGPIKTEGTLRPIFLRLSLWVIARVAEGVPFLPKIGSGINIPTVATARWIATDRGRRLMFISNYTNEGKAYVRDFIETHGGAMRINLSFGFGTGYPPTEWVIWGGAIDDPNAYLHSLAENQLPTLFWYGPLRDLSIDNIKVNRKIREGLFDDTQDAQTWLHLL